MPGGGTRCNSEDEIKVVLAPYFIDAGAYDISYTATTQADPKQIIANRLMLLDIREKLHKRGALVQSSCRNVLLGIAAEMEEEWHLGSPDAQWDWADDTTTMIRNMGRHAKFAQPSPC